MKQEFMVKCSDGELAQTFGPYPTLEAAEDWFNRCRVSTEALGRKFEGKIIFREISDWEQVYPLVLDISMHAQPGCAIVNGKDDFQEENQHPKMPFIVPDPRFEGEWRWQFKVDVDTGVILGWPEGTTAEAWYKCSDDIKIKLGSADLNDGGYVPKFLRPRGDDDDCIELVVANTGRILEWDSARAKKWIASRKRLLKLA